VTVICGKFGVPWFDNAEPRSASEVAGGVYAPAKIPSRKVNQT
jgi:hypothetical protein